MSSIGWLDQIPRHWDALDLKLVVDKISSGVSVNATDVSAAPGEPGVLKTSAVIGGRFIPEENKAVWSAEYERLACSVKADSIIVSRMNTPALVAESAYVEADYNNLFLPDRLWQVELNRSRAVPKFVAIVLSSSIVRSFLAEMATGTSASMKNLSQEDLLNFTIPLPPISEQFWIVRFLDRETADIDALIAAKQLLLDLLAEKRRAIVAEAITRGLNPAAPLRPSGIDWLGEIPAHWEVRRIATLFTQRDERSQPELPLLEVSINSGVIIREFSNDKIEGTASDFNTYKVARRGDIAFNKMRMWQGAVGVAPVDGLVSPDYTVAEAASCLRPEYAGLLFRTDSFSAECGRNSQGITWDRLRLYWDGFRDIFMPLPPLAEQDAILEAVQAETTKIDRLRAATEHSITLLKERRGALIAAAVTGQIDIPEAA
jgi:type I restriction enzyme, S subunit